jgi:hypothetical protein
MWGDNLYLDGIGYGHSHSDGFRRWRGAASLRGKVSTQRLNYGQCGFWHPPHPELAKSTASSAINSMLFMANSSS